MIRTARRRGFTLVELLVVIVVIAILIALLLPAIQAAREAARMSTCRGNMHQIGLALVNYHDVFHKFPPGTSALSGFATVGAEQKNNMSLGRNWVILIMPFIEQQTLYDTINWATFKTDSGGSGFLAYSSSTGIPYNSFTSTEMPIMLCPSDHYNDVQYHVNHNSNSFSTTKIYQYYARGNYAANSCLQPPFNYYSVTDVHGNVSTPMPTPCGGPTMAAWQPGYQTSWMTRGVMGYSASVSMRQITDGTSTTVAVWEVRAGVNADDFRGLWADGRPAASTVWFHIFGPNTCTVADDNATLVGNMTASALTLTQECMLMQGSASGNAAGFPRSVHPGGLNGLFCDGSVRFVSELIDRGSSPLDPYVEFTTGDTTRLHAWERINASADGLEVEEDDLDP